MYGFYNPNQLLAIKRVVDFVRNVPEATLASTQVPVSGLSLDALVELQENGDISLIDTSYYQLTAQGRRNAIMQYQAGKLN